MARNVSTRGAQQALAKLIRGDVESATPNNAIVSKDESKALHPFVRRAAEEVRGDKPKYGRVQVDEVVDRAMSTAMAAWNEVNPRSNPRDHRYLAQAEIAALGKSDPELAELTLRAYELVRGGDPAAAVRSAIEARPGFGALLRRASSFGTTIAARVGDPGRDALPAAVRSAFDVHYVVEAADLGGATLKQFPLAGQQVYSLYGTTDGDDQRLELFDANGQALASARFYGDQFVGWDQNFGDGRFASIVGRRGHPITEGYSETDEQRAHGQITNDWRPDAVVDGGTLRHDRRMLTSFETPIAVAPEHRDVLRATLELAYERTIQHAAFGQPEVDLARLGAVRIGTHHDATNGQDYIVGDWKDIDDASSTFYFQRDPHGQLFIAREQYNN